MHCIVGVDFDNTLVSYDELLHKTALDFGFIEPGTLKPETNYRELKNWSSMYALIVIAFVDLNFDITLNAQDLRNTLTIQNLYDLVQSKKKSV